MSREAYQVPSFDNQQGQFSGGAASAAAPTNPNEELLSVIYVCGDCSARVQMKRGDQIRCKECGHRVLYKERTKRMVQFQAR
ncbi:DNA-directed RNA polymerase core subunit rpc10 [Emydomyces testavorans]|uniref:DNA-directed RNA polymerase core subunit rpc10 n=1 Tax=Emydomyces testavorans TaxID=2070801 RepID=A0AAF0DLJ9_9EURO|nr:DNA-directed RNA polymerase core subunit rpc10 [Emydomyces testavorans]